MHIQNGLAGQVVIVAVDIDRPENDDRLPSCGLGPTQAEEYTTCVFVQDKCAGQQAQSDQRQSDTQINCGIDYPHGRTSQGDVPARRFDCQACLYSKATSACAIDCTMVGLGWIESFVSSGPLTASMKANKKSRRDRTPEGLPPRRLTRQRATRLSGACSLSSRPTTEESV
jgi:hypothetical protein